MKHANPIMYIFAMTRAVIISWQARFRLNEGGGGDRGCCDTQHLINLLAFNWESNGVVFVVRGVGKFAFESFQERELPQKYHQDILVDQEIARIWEQETEYRWNFSQLVTSLRLNTFTKLRLCAWLNKFFDRHEQECEKTLFASR